MQHQNGNDGTRAVKKLLDDCVQWFCRRKARLAKLSIAMALKLLSAGLAILLFSPAFSGTPQVLPSGFVLYTSPFGAIELHARIRWIDNKRLASMVVDRSQAGSPQSGFRVWNVDSDEVIDVKGRDLECIAPGNPEPILLTRGLKEIAPKVFPRYLGPPGHEERVPQEDGPVYSFESRKKTLQSGIEVKQTPLRDHSTGCRTRWIPNDDTPPHMVQPIQKKWPIFGDRMVVISGAVNGVGEKPKPTTIYLANRQEPIVLPVSACFGHPGVYHAFKNAYLGAGVNAATAKASGSQYEIDENGCLRWGYWGAPLGYGWLHADGRIESGILPSPLTLLPKPEQVRIEQLNKAGRYQSSEGKLIPTAVGFIYDSGLFGSIKYRLYLFTNNRYVEIYRGDHLHAFNVSPNGCRLAFEEHGAQSNAFEDSPLKVIDLCQPGQFDPTSTK